MLFLLLLLLLLVLLMLLLPMISCDQSAFFCCCCCSYVSEIIGLDRATVEALLQAHRWQRDVVVEVMTNDPDAALAAAHLTSHEKC